MPDKPSSTSRFWEQLYSLDTERLWKHHITEDGRKHLQQLANIWMDNFVTNIEEFVNDYSLCIILVYPDSDKIQNNKRPQIVKTGMF